MRIDPIKIGNRINQDDALRWITNRNVPKNAAQHKNLNGMSQFNLKKRGIVLAVFGFFFCVIAWQKVCTSLSSWNDIGVMFCISNKIQWFVRRFYVLKTVNPSDEWCLSTVRLKLAHSSARHWIHCGIIIAFVIFNRIKSDQKASIKKTA